MLIFSSKQKQVSCKNAFKHGSNEQWDYVFNCAAETRPAQTEAVYTEGIFKLSLNCINEAIAHNVQRYIEFSSGSMQSSEQWPVKEDCCLKPWTQVAQQKAKVEQELCNHSSELNYTILRLPIVYGKSDRRGLSE